MSTLMQASTQWANRPDDQRFVSLLEINDYLQHVKANSKSAVIANRRLKVAPIDQKGLQLIGTNGNVEISNWAFGQMASRASAPAAYLRSLPAPMAADCLNYGLQVERQVEELSVLVYKNGGPAELRAVNGPNYGRIWNADISAELVDRFGDGISGKFRVPGEFGKKIEVTKQNTTLYASDRDMFVFLADEENRIVVPHRRDGKSGSLARGFFMWNSEVGASTFGVATFLFDYACCNRIVWGAEGYREIKIRHTSGAPDRWAEQVVPQLEDYANSATAGITKMIKAAQARKVEKVDEFLKQRFTAKMAGLVQAAHLQDEGRPIETMWDMATGITAHARSIPFQDERIKLEREAGLILDMV